ncbi:hypothetical protein HPB47_026286 [Ixodes persulcatus]|uniref:Uncharacterized protein n=1 Tax=Ixodes persulcatus TaxID=34615 RepID=A0AC60Q163_IXOPE|nr:hypothetical protein HPB47_026286 [Ixodes persulcatus]
MRIVLLSALTVAMLLLLCVAPADATKHLIFAPFIWAGSLVKDATHGLIAHKLSIATKLLAMITGNRSFRASVQYDSRLEKYQKPPAATGSYFHKVPEVVPKPSPVNVEHDVKVDWLPGVKMPHPHFPHPHLPSLPSFHLPKLPLPDLSHLTKFHKMPQLPSVAGMFHGPKFASGYVNGGFKIGHGGSADQVRGRSFNFTIKGPLKGRVAFGDASDTVTSPKAVVQELTSNSTRNFTTTVMDLSQQLMKQANGTNSTLPKFMTGRVAFGGESDTATSPKAVVQELTKVATSNAARNFTTTVMDLSQQLMKQANGTNSTLPKFMNRRSADKPSLATYFSFIQSNDEGDCIPKMICSMAAQPHEFGDYGAKVLEFFEAMEPSPSAPARAYKEAIRRGQQGIYIVGAKRTPFGAMGGKLKDFTPTQLAVIASKAALDSAGVKPENVDVCIAGIINQVAAKDSPYCSRHTALQCGLPQHTPCLNVNRMCGSGFQSAVNAVQEILLGNAEIALTVGTENMSMSPFIVRDARFGIKFGMQPEMECSLLSTLTDMYCKMPMAITAENLAVKYKVSREDADQFALQSSTVRIHASSAQEAGRFKEEMVPIPVKVKGKEVMFDTDEHPRPGTTMETLAKLPSLFKKDGTVTAGNASAVKRHNLKPLARIVGYSYVGVDPTIMGIGPAPAIRKLCDKTGVKLQDLDLVDVNEAFASQFLAVERDLQLDPAKSNVNGGAIALGHPVGASGARILANLTYELRDRKGKYAVGSACIGGGQGIAVMLESV